MSFHGYNGAFQVRASEVGLDKRIRVPYLVQLMQEGSMRNSLEQNFSTWDMEEEKLSWVLVRKKLTILSYPILSQQIRLLTYPIITKNVFAHRDFKIYNEENELMASASSVWVLMNLETRKMQRIPKRFNFFEAPENEEILEPPTSRVVEIENVDFSKSFVPNYYDTDWNDHVNNIFFLKSMIASGPSEFINNREIRELTYHIKSESRLGDTLHAQGEVKGDNTFHKLTNQEDRPLAYAQISWE